MRRKAVRLALGVSGLVLIVVLAGIWWAVSRGRATPASHFHGMTVAWPGPPTETVTTIPGPSGEVRTHHAMYTSAADGRPVVFTASVTDLGPATKEMSPRELLEAHAFASRKDEVSRQEVEHGPKKLPGLDIVVRTGGNVRRQRLVASGTRIFEVAAMARTEEALGAREVRAFFESFAVDG
jgi:hypothetical protein